MEQAIVSQTKIVKIGNSKGIVIPKKMLQAFGEEVRLKLKDDTIEILCPIENTTESYLYKTKIVTDADYKDL